MNVQRALNLLRFLSHFFYGKNFFSERENSRAFSKFCRLIVSINFGFARPRRHNDNVIPLLSDCPLWWGHGRMAGHAAARRNAFLRLALMPGEMVGRPLLPCVGRVKSRCQAGCLHVWWLAVVLMRTAPTAASSVCA